MLPLLNPDPQANVDVQQTAFSHDVRPLVLRHME